MDLANVKDSQYENIVLPKITINSTNNNAKNSHTFSMVDSLLFLSHTRSNKTDSNASYN